MSAFPDGTSTATTPTDGKACSAVCRAVEVMVLGSGGVEYWWKEMGMEEGGSEVGEAWGRTTRWDGRVRVTCEGAAWGRGVGGRGVVPGGRRG